MRLEVPTYRPQNMIYSCTPAPVPTCLQIRVIGTRFFFFKTNDDILRDISPRTITTTLAVRFYDVCADKSYELVRVQYVFKILHCSGKELCVRLIFHCAYFSKSLLWRMVTIYY